MTWVIVFSLVLFACTLILNMFCMGVWPDNNYNKWYVSMGLYALGITLALYGLYIFHLAKRLDWMLWIAFVVYIVPLAIFSMVSSLIIRQNAEFILAIPGYIVLWLITRWIYDTVPE
jgi:hypothetical protein